MNIYVLVIFNHFVHYSKSKFLILFRLFLQSHVWSGSSLFAHCATFDKRGGGQKILNWNLFNGPYLCEIDFRCKRPTANLYMDKPKETHSTHSNNNSQFSPYHRGMAAADTSRALSRREYHFTSPNVALYALHLFNFNALLRFLPRHFPPIIKISRSLLRAIHYSAIFTLFFRP